MKRFKKASIILLVCMLLSVIAMPVSASAAKLNKKSVSLNVGKTYTLKDGVPYAGEKGNVKPGMWKFKNIDGSKDNKICICIF